MLNFFNSQSNSRDKKIKLKINGQLAIEILEQVIVVD
jgi:hypothetical protein